MVQFVGIVSSCKVSIKQKRCLFFRNAQLLYDLASQGLKERKNMLYEVFKEKISYLYKHDIYIYFLIMPFACLVKHYGTFCSKHSCIK